MRLINFNPRSPYGERLQYKLIIIDGFDISIHAPLTGSDLTSHGRINRL